MRLSSNEMGHNIQDNVCYRRTITWNIFKNGKTDFIQVTAVGVRDLSLKLSSTPKTDGDLQLVGKVKGSVDGKL